VTNPPLDAIREQLVTSLSATIGPEGNLLEATPAHCRQVRAAVPGDRQRRAGQAPLHQRRRRPAGLRRRPGHAGCTASTSGGRGLARGSEQICAEVDALIADGKRFVILSDRDSDRDRAPIPSLLLCSAVHHHLVRTKSAPRSA
jgi:glutamate synthase (NADPH) large chain